MTIGKQITTTKGTASNRMKMINIVSVILLSSSLTNTLAGSYLEPKVQRHAGVLPASVCKQLIKLGEEAGFLVKEESIDEKEQSDPNEKYIPSQTIDVYRKGWSEPGLPEPKDGHVISIDNVKIWSVLEPHVPALTRLVKNNRDAKAFGEYYPHEPDREPHLNWVFFRKYSPQDERNSLKTHVDTNMNTLNIALNDDYHGGGWFYVKPSMDQDFDAEDGRPDVKEEYRNYGWTNGVKRENTTEVIFPSLLTGDAVLYNFTVYHGVAPVESGVRYAMSLFYDLDNPAVVENDNSSFEHDDEDFEVQVHNKISDLELDIFLVYDAAQRKELWEVMFDRVTPGEIVRYSAYASDMLLAVVAGTEKVVSQFRVKADQLVYVIKNNQAKYGDDEEEL